MVQTSRDPHGSEGLLDPRRPLVGGSHLLRDGPQETSLHRRLRDRSDFQDLPDSRLAYRAVMARAEPASRLQTDLPTMDQEQAQGDVTEL